MSVGDVLYRIGELADSGVRKFIDFINPSPSEESPSFRYLRKLVKKEFTPHEYLSLKLQLTFLLYLILNLTLLFLRVSPLWLLAVAVIYFLYLRYTLVKNKEFFVDYEPYRSFYYPISAMSFIIFVGYIFVRRIATSIYYYYAYLLVAFAVVMTFRWYFKQRYGRDYTYGIVEEIKGDVVKVFVHDDIAANVKPGYYWVDAVEDLEVGRVVKLIVEDRKLKGAVPVKIIEVYLTDQSSQSSIEPKEETE